MDEQEGRHSLGTDRKNKYWPWYSCRLSIGQMSATNEQERLENEVTRRALTILIGVDENTRSSLSMQCNQPRKDGLVAL